MTGADAKRSGAPGVIMSSPDGAVCALRPPPPLDDGPPRLRGFRFSRSIGAATGAILMVETKFK